MFCLMFALVQVFIAVSYGKPMESHSNYNVILVHGAGGRYFGLDCDNNSNIKEASGYLSERDTIQNEQKDYQELIGGYGRVLDVDVDFSGRGLELSLLSKKRESSAQDMDLEDDGKKIGLRHWLTEDVFENDKSVIYLQRPFTNPANSPINNARELGDPTWQGKSNCDVRRSLIEEAQEIKAKGRTNLTNLRKDVENRDKLSPSRNILIAHSMGGVTSREYVQGTFYNDDVDKVITLDSPHEGTGSLEMLLEMSDWEARIKPSLLNSFGAYIVANAFLAATAKNMSAATIALYSLIPTLTIMSSDAITFGMGQALIAGLDKHYQPDDSLVSYIDPNLYHGIDNLISRPYTDNLPMMRLLYGKNSMTFSDPNYINGFNMFTFMLPMTKSAISSYYNLYSQFSGEGSFTVNLINSMTSYTAGMLFGVTIGDHGTTLIPQSSGKAENTIALDGIHGNVMRKSYDGHVTKELGLVKVDPAIEFISIAITASAATIVAVNYIPFLSTPVAESIKSVIAIAASLLLVSDVAIAITAGLMDLADSHEAPLSKEYQRTWEVNKNTYYEILGNQKNYVPTYMEDFLYEKPFANIRVISNYDSQWQDKKMDSLGLYVKKTFYDTTYAEGQENITETIKSVPIYIADRLSGSNPLNFKSPSDWETMGAKKVRWTKTAGVEDSIPIRHADRYPMPAMPVDEFIYKYEFEIDDLMPHRLRQIRLSFNYNEEIAWECDINKSETADDACTVYKRGSNGRDWEKIGEEKHPVQKNGIFDMHNTQTRFKRNLAIFLS